TQALVHALQSRPFLDELREAVSHHSLEKAEVVESLAAFAEVGGWDHVCRRIHRPFHRCLVKSIAVTLEIERAPPDLAERSLKRSPCVDPVEELEEQDAE